MLYGFIPEISAVIIWHNYTYTVSNPYKYQHDGVTEGTKFLSIIYILNEH